MKLFVKAVKQDSCGFQDLKVKFGTEKSDAKLKASIFIRPEIRKLMSDSKFKGKLNPVKLTGTDLFVEVVRNFLRNHRVETYADLINNVLTAYERARCQMSRRMHLYSRLILFPTNLGAVSTSMV